MDPLTLLTQVTFAYMTPSEWIPSHYIMIKDPFTLVKHEADYISETNSRNNGFQDIHNV